MLNLSRHSHNSGNTVDDMADSEIGSFSQESRLPRHMSVLESPSHSRSRKVRPKSFQIRQCPLKQQNRSAEATNLAVNIIRYQLCDRASQDRHLTNLRSNLQHRLETAQAKNNEGLVTLLREEFRQLETNI